MQILLRYKVLKMYVTYRIMYENSQKMQLNHRTKVKLAYENVFVD